MGASASCPQLFMELLAWLIDYLAEYNGMKPTKGSYSFSTFRALMNITMPYSLSQEYYVRQNQYLQQKIAELGIIDAKTLSFVEDRIALYQGDIVPIQADAIVTAGNEELLGCFVPNHNCIDNAIFSYAGLQLRREMMEFMEKQGHKEENGQVKVSHAYNLPSQYIFHTVGPIVRGQVREKDREDLMNCYLSCLKKASEMGLESLVFPSISTGVFAFPIEEASCIAIKTVREYLSKHQDSSLKIVVFDAYSKGDYEIYEAGLGKTHR